MFMPSIWIGLQKKGSKARIITHMDKAIDNTWSILGWLFFLTVIGISVFVYFTGNSYCFALMLPLSLLYAGIGVAIMGVITEFKLMVYTPLVAFAVAIYMLALMEKKIVSLYNALLLPIGGICYSVFRVSS